MLCLKITEGSPADQEQQYPGYYRSRHRKYVHILERSEKQGNHCSAAHKSRNPKTKGAQQTAGRLQL
jgi:hypothetical protein